MVVIRMTAPPERLGKAIYELPYGKVLFSSWILLFGIRPIDRHTFFIKSIGHQLGFAEASIFFTSKRWQHQRDINRNGASCLVTDIVEFQCRLPVLAYDLAPAYRFIFKHRHQALGSYYGGSTS
jgi:hypothetical protein